jgi:hypothetical protein
MSRRRSSTAHLTQIIGLFGISLFTMFLGSQFVHVIMKPDVNLTQLIEAERERRKKLDDLNSNKNNKT